MEEDFLPMSECCRRELAIKNGLKIIKKLDEMIDVIEQISFTISTINL